jgi:hypothetical protein
MLGIHGSRTFGRVHEIRDTAIPFDVHSTHTVLVQQRSVSGNLCRGSDMINHICAYIYIPMHVGLTPQYPESISTTWRIYTASRRGLERSTQMALMAIQRRFLHKGWATQSRVDLLGHVRHTRDRVGRVSRKLASLLRPPYEIEAFLEKIVQSILAM